MALSEQRKVTHIHPVKQKYHRAFSYDLGSTVSRLNGLMEIFRFQFSTADTEYEVKNIEKYSKTFCSNSFKNLKSEVLIPSIYTEWYNRIILPITLCCPVKRAIAIAACAVLCNVVL
jgi:hypothetical protein